MRFILFIYGSLITMVVHAQTEAGRQAIGSFGHSHQGQVYISATVGEAAIGTRQEGAAAVTQGFQQPLDKGAISFELKIVPASCPTSTDGIAEIHGLEGCTPPYIVQWSNGLEGVSNNRLAPGLHSVTVRTSTCEVTYEFEVTAGPMADCMLRFFTAFSPNGDGVNDLWTIENITLPEFADNEVKIFNRWGQQVWSGMHYDNHRVAWDGRDRKGRKLPPGTYFFIAEVAGITHKGYIEITI